MKNLLLILLLANILYFVWGMFEEETSQPGIAVVEESDLGPPLAVIAARDSDTVASVGAILGSGEPSALEAIVGRSCVTIGPIRVISDADAAVLAYTNEGMRTRLWNSGARVHILKLGPVDSPMTAGHPRNLLFATPERVARDILRVIERGRFAAYLPWYWGPIMLVVRNLPEVILQRLAFLSGR